MIELLQWIVIVVAFCVAVAAYAFARRIHHATFATFEQVSRAMTYNHPQTCTECGGRVLLTTGPGRSTKVAPILWVELQPNIVASQCCECGYVQECPAKSLLAEAHVQ